MSEYEVTKRNRVRQIREVARYDREAVHGVLDAGLVSHVGFVSDGQPFVIPMIFGREGGLPAESASARAPALCSVHGGPLR